MLTTTNAKTIMVNVPGTCGELLQGMIDNTLVHVTCPVAIYTRVKTSIGRHGGFGRAISMFWKLQKALNIFKERYHVREDISVEVRSDIPQGKGMASSTADIVGVCLGAARITNKKITPDEIAAIALAIEPTDGIMYKGIVLYDHRQGKIREYVGKAPAIQVLAIDTGGTVDSIKFNNSGIEMKYRKNEKNTIKALELIKKGIREQSVSLIGEGATMSALSNQDILRKPVLEKIIDVGAQMGALGVNVAHSGSMIGILLNDEFADYDCLKRRILEITGRQTHFYKTKLVGGGGMYAC